MLIAVGVAATAIHFAYVLLAPIPFQEARNIVDDAYYYWVIARQFWQTGFFTFDGIHPTSGFQPLWQWMLLPFGLLSHTLQLRLSMLLAAACYQAAAWALVLIRGLPERFTRAAGLAALALWVNARMIFEFASSGMEFGLYMLVGTAAILSAAKVLWSGGPRRHWLILLWLSTVLLPLARVDGLGLSGLIWLWVLIRSPKRGRIVIAGVLSAAPFFLWLYANQAVFGFPFPVSGLAKRMDQLEDLRAYGIEQGSLTWWGIGLRKSAVLFASNVLRFFTGFLPPGPWPRIAMISGAMFFSAGAVVLGWWRRRAGAGEKSGGAPSPGPRLWEPAAVLLVFSVIQAAVYSFVIPGTSHYAQWYYGPMHMGVALALGQWLRPIGVALAAKAAAGFLLMHAAALLLLPQPIQIANPGLRSAIKALEELNPPPGTRVGSWNSGLVAFLAPEQVQVINLDGLVNSVEFARQYAGDADLRPYLEQQHVRYLIDYATGENPEMWRQILAFRLGTYKAGGDLNVRVRHLGEVEEGTEAEPRRYFVLEILPDSGMGED